jgi:type II secretory ATPase GspE/PulE/Tfp pilus assembly ATPase PilB-like protein
MTLERMKKVLRRPHGIILVTGPTGSGKTTTLYAALAHISSIARNIVTIEDPVEYQLEYINQIQVNDAHKLTFAKTLKSILRQDPDIIMIGEIRDRETAEVSIQASLTGHLVLSTLHTNESAGAVSRLIEMGIEPYLLSSALVGVMAQRLVRLVCDNCKTSYLPPTQTLKRIGWKGANVKFVTGHGCEKCFDSGMRGRVGIFELLTVDEPMRQLILNEPTTEAVREIALRGGMRSLADQAFSLVEQGLTPLEEVLRVVMVEEISEDGPLMMQGQAG